MPEAGVRHFRDGRDVSDRDAISKQAAEFLKEHRPGRYWAERRKLHRELKRERDVRRLREQIAEVKRSPEEPSFVYVIGASGHPVKVGIAADVRKRLSGIQTGCPTRLRVYFEIEVEDARAVERAAHKRLFNHKLSGEWFDCEPAEAVEAIKAALAA